jgi:hypothetical protein
LRVFLVGDAVACAKTGQKVPSGYCNTQSMLGAVVRSGGCVGVCGTCIDARGITEAACSTPRPPGSTAGTYLGEKRILAIGLGFDRQSGLVIGGTPDRTYQAWTADVFLDLPVGRGALTVEGSYTDVQDLPQGLAFASVPAGGDARMAYLQAGYLLPWPIGPGRVQLYGRAERVLVSDGEDRAAASATSRAATTSS